MTKAKQNKKVGLALGGGGAKGLAHIGVIKELERAGVEISFISGNSAGALIGGLYAATKDIESIEDFFRSIKKEDIFSSLHMMRKKDGEMFKNNLLEKLKDRIKGINVEETKIPFAAVATDVETGDEIVLRQGNLKDAIQASTALPLVFSPITIDGRLLMDGGFVNPVPANIVRNMGADFVIAVDVSSRWVNLEHESLSPTKYYQAFPHALSIIEYQLARNILKTADVVMNPDVLNYHWNDFDACNAIVKAGVTQAKIHMKEICNGIGLNPPKKKTIQSFADLIFYGVDTD